MERTARIPKWTGAMTEKMVINSELKYHSIVNLIAISDFTNSASLDVSTTVEWGAFGSGTAFSLLPFHRY